MNSRPAWSTTVEPVLGARGQRHRVCQGQDAVTWADALDLLGGSDAFRRFLNGAILSAGYTALRWETPPVSASSRHRPFEFVLVDDPFLDTAPEPGVFAPYFESEPAAVDVLAVSNLGRTARLVVPRQLTKPEDYVHLSAFLQSAPEAQVHALWRCVARTARQELSGQPLWISTAGGGVSWLHLRLECTPKYYSFRPYARAA